MQTPYNPSPGERLGAFGLGITTQEIDHLVLVPQFKMTLPSDFSFCPYFKKVQWTPFIMSVTQL